MFKPLEYADALLKTWKPILIGHLGLQSMSYQDGTPCITDVSKIGYPLEKFESLSHPSHRLPSLQIRRVSPPHLTEKKTSMTFQFDTKI